MDKPNLRINPIIATFMIVVALIYDGFKILIDILSVGFLGWIVNPFINFWAMMTFLFWFAYLGISFIKPGKMMGARLASMSIPSFIGLLPLIGDLPLWTSGVVTNLATVYAEDLIGAYSPQALQAMAQGMGNNKKGSEQDALDELNTKKDLDDSDKERLVRAREVMESGQIRQGEQDEVVLAAYEKYKRGVRVYEGINTVDENGNFQRDQGYKFSNVHHFGGEGIRTVNSIEQKYKQQSNQRYKESMKTNKTEPGELEPTDEEQIDWPIAI